MKKVFSILLIIAMLLNFCSCQQGNSKVEFNPNTKTATITIISNGAVKINVKK